MQFNDNISSFCTLNIYITTNLFWNRTGKYKRLRAYKSLLDGSDPTCPLCVQGSQNLQHWLQRCQATEKLRINLFGKESGGLYYLTKHPVQTVALGRRTLSSGHNKIFYKLRELTIYSFVSVIYVNHNFTFQTMLVLIFTF